LSVATETNVEQNKQTLSEHNKHTQLNSSKPHHQELSDLVLSNSIDTVVDRSLTRR